MLALPLKLAGPVIAKMSEVMSVPVQIPAADEMIAPPGAPTPHEIEEEL